LNVSEQQAEPIDGESGSLNAERMGPHLPDATRSPVTVSATEVTPEAASIESPGLAPGQGEAVESPKAETRLPKADDFKIDDFMPSATKAEIPKVEAPKVEAAKTEAPRADAPRTPGKIMIMSSGDRAWDSLDTGPEPESKSNAGMFGKRRFSALAAVVALAAIAGALGGALATAGLAHFAGGDTAAAATTGNQQAFEASVARLDADIAALKAGVEHTSRLGVTQFKQTSDRLDKVEKAQAEPAAKLAKLSEAVDKLHAAPPATPVAAAAPAAAKEVTGSIPAPAATTVVPPKVELARLPTVGNWVLRDVANGGALVEGRQGIFEIYAGDSVPGLGRVDAIRRQDGRWVVVTSKGLIVAR
jgi:hypothetical protein